MSIGGSAHLQGLSLYTDTKQVSVYKNGLTIINYFDSIGMNIKPVGRIPIIRQFPVVFRNKILWPLFPLFIGAHVLQLFTKSNANHAMLYALPILIACIYAIRVCTDLFRFHGAEHQVIACMEGNHRLSLNNVRAQSRAHIRCGSTLVVLLFLLWAASEFCTYAYMCKLASIFLALELLHAVQTYKALSYIKRLVLWIQYHVMTQKPTDSQLKLAIRCAKILCQE